VRLGGDVGDIQHFLAQEEGLIDLEGMVCCVRGKYMHGRNHGPLSTSVNPGGSVRVSCTYFDYKIINNRYIIFAVHLIPLSFGTSMTHEILRVIGFDAQKAKR
jgi:hypothetical protein